jgi:hypothetical protein
VTVKVKLGRAVRERASARGPFYPIASRSRTLPEPTSDGEVIASIACELFRGAGIVEPVRLLGVSVSGLDALGEGRQAPAQLSLFDPPQRSLGPALDAITRRFGAGAIRRAVDTPGKITHGRGIKRGER